MKKIKGTLIGLRVPENAPKQKRAKKENRRKSNSRKKERAEAAAEDLVSLITCGKEHFAPDLLLADTDIVCIEKIMELHIKRIKLGVLKLIEAATMSYGCCQELCHFLVSHYPDTFSVDDFFD